MFQQENFIPLIKIFISEATIVTARVSLVYSWTAAASILYKLYLGSPKCVLLKSAINNATNQQQFVYLIYLYLCSHQNVSLLLLLLLLLLFKD